MLKIYIMYYQCHLSFTVNFVCTIKDFSFPFPKAVEVSVCIFVHSSVKSQNTSGKVLYLNVENKI